MESSQKKDDDGHRLMGRDKDAYFEFHKLFGQAIEKCYKLNDWLAAKFIAGELNGISSISSQNRKKRKKLPRSKITLMSKPLKQK